MRQRRWIELFNDYYCKIRYYPGKANIVANALSRKAWMKSRRARAISMKIHSRIKARILEDQNTMVDMNSPINDAPAEQAPAIKPQKGLIFQVVVAILKNTNFFKAFMASFMILVIYIQQFWNTMQYDSSIGMSVRKDGKETFGMSILDALLTYEIKRVPYYGKYLEHVTKYQQYLNEEHGKAKEGGVTKSPKATKVIKPKAAKQTRASTHKATKHTSSQPPTSTPAPLNPPRKTKLVDEFLDEGVLEKEPAYDDEEANLQPALELSLKEQQTHGPARLVVFREPDSGRFQPLPEVHGKGKEKVIDEHTAHDLLTIQTPKKKSPADQFILQRWTPMSTKSFRNIESPFINAELTMTDNVTKSDEEVAEINSCGSCWPNLEHMNIKATDASTQQNYEQMDEEFTTNDYPNVLENLKLLTEDQLILDDPTSSTRTLSSLQSLDKELSFTNKFLVEKPHEKEPEKTNTEFEPPPLPSLAGASGAPSTSGASGPSQLPPHPPPPNTDTRKDWWKPLPKEERLVTPELAWTNPSSNVSNIENNWASALDSTYEPPAENSLLAKISDMMTFINWYGNKGSCPALLISKMKAARYLDFGLKLLVPDQMWIDDVCTYAISAKYGYEFKHDYTIIDSPRAVVFLINNNK
nr:putative reverse transcriptase domain-containing protein [Tanacetum cinerariifolium]